MSAQPVGYKAKAFEPRSLILFFLLAFGLTWMKSLLTVLFDIRLPDRFNIQVVLIILFIGLLMGFGPTVAAFVVTGAREGKAGVKALLKRFWNRNMSLKWIILIVLFFDVMRLVANLITRLVDGETYPVFHLPDEPLTLLASFVTAFVFNGIGEEFGWRGYALPRFQAKWNALISSLILGIIWACWHLPFFLTPGAALYGRDFLSWVPGIILLSFFTTWIFNNTGGSVLAAALFHAMGNISIVLLPTQASWWYLYGVELAAAILIVIVFGPDLVRQEPEEAIGQKQIQAMGG